MAYSTVGRDNCLRVRDLGSQCWGWLGTRGWFTFNDEKVNGQDTSYRLSPYMEQWRAHIYGQRRADFSQRHSPVSPEVFPLPAPKQG